MPAIEFRLPRGAILFTDDAFGYECREDLGEAHNGLSRFVARRRTRDGNHPRGKVLLKAVGVPRGMDVDGLHEARVGRTHPLCAPALTASHGRMSCLPGRSPPRLAES